ncbi:MAG: phosphatidylglycerophosphatase A [Spirochaetes bacterium]|jgi:phosphatidylglycerophosphatase A|nr:phosphatidylglycerophosphatase A [Spirochaetota bacterium]
METIKKLVYTAFFSGMCPVAPGTAGTLIAVIIYIVEYLFFGDYCRISNLVLVAVLAVPAVKIADSGEKYFGRKDPPQFVLDEVVGYWIGLLFHGFSWTLVAAGFVIFRILDIFKPFPINRAQRLNGGLGVVMDDYIAGIYTNLILWCLVFFMEYIGVGLI